MSTVTEYEKLSGSVLLQVFQRAARGENAALVVEKGYDPVHDRVMWVREERETGYLVHGMRVSGSTAYMHVRTPIGSFYDHLLRRTLPGTTWPLDTPAMARALAFTHDTDPRAVLVLLERWLIPPVALMCLEYVTGQWPTLDMQLEVAEPPPPPPPCPNDDEDRLPERKKQRTARS